MELITKARGKITVTEDHLITIPAGLFGFEQYTKYALVDSDYEPFLWLQSCEDPNLAFLIVDPFLICSEYETDIDDASLKKIGITKPEDIIIIHDGIRPLVDETVLTDVIRKAQKYGNAVSSLPYNEQIFVIDDEIRTTKYIPRETLRRVATPQAYRFDLLNSKYHEAYKKEIGIYGSHYTNTMMVELGVRLYFAAGSDKNLKLTTKDDLEMFKAYLKSDKDNWLK